MPESGQLRAYVNHISAQGATKLRLPAVQIARDTNGDCHLIDAENNQVFGADGQPAVFAYTRGSGWSENTWGADDATIISNYGITLQDNEGNEFEVSTELWTTSQRDELPEVSQLQYKW